MSDPHNTIIRLTNVQTKHSLDLEKDKDSWKIHKDLCKSTPYKLDGCDAYFMTRVNALYRLDNPTAE